MIGLVLWKYIESKGGKVKVKYIKIFLTKLVLSKHLKSVKLDISLNLLYTIVSESLGLVSKYFIYTFWRTFDPHIMFG